MPATCARDAGHSHPGEHADNDCDHHGAWFQHATKGNQRHEKRHGEGNVDEAHQTGIEPARPAGRDDADQDADQQGDRRGHGADEQRNLPALDDHSQHIAAEAVGSQRMARGQRRHSNGFGIDGNAAIAAQQSPADAERHDGQQQHKSGPSGR